MPEVRFRSFSQRELATDVLSGSIHRPILLIRSAPGHDGRAVGGRVDLRERTRGLQRERGCCMAQQACRCFVHPVRSLQVRLGRLADRSPLARQLPGGSAERI